MHVYTARPSRKNPVLELDELEDKHLPQFHNKVFGFLLKKLTKSSHNFLWTGALHQPYFDDVDKVVLDFAHILDAFLMQPWTDLAFDDHRFAQQLPVNRVREQLLLGLGHLPKQFGQFCLKLLLLLATQLGLDCVDLREVQLVGFLFRLLVLLVDDEKAFWLAGKSCILTYRLQFKHWLQGLLGTCFAVLSR